jgi:hypothetical protein
MVGRSVQVLGFGGFDAGRTRDIRKTDALAICRGVPHSHVQEHRVFIEGQQGCDDLSRIVLPDGLDEPRHFMQQAFFSHFGKLLHTWTVAKNQVCDKLARLMAVSQ